MNVFTYWAGPTNPMIDLCHETIRRHNPDFTVLSPNDIPEHIRKAVAHRSVVAQSDVFRLWYLAHHGGIWIDSDCICIRGLDLDQHLSKGFAAIQNTTPNSPVTNYILAAEPRSTIADKLFKEAFEAAQSNQILNYTALGQGIMQKYRDHIKVLQHWRYAYIHWNESYIFNRHSNDHAYEHWWNPNACCYHLTNKVVSWFKSKTREGIIHSKTFIGFLFRRALGRHLQPGRAEAILQRLPPKNHEGVEVGVLAGQNAHTLMQQHRGLHLHLVDPWKEWEPSSTYRNSKDSNSLHSQKKWDQMLEKVQKYLWFAEDRYTIHRCLSAETIIENPFWVFLDANHQQAAVEQDIRHWWPQIQPGGWIGGHDYNHPREITGHWGVKKAADAFAATHGLSVEIDKDDTWFIRKPS